MESNVGHVMFAALSAKAILPIAGKYDALLVSSYSDHTLIRQLRKELGRIDGWHDGSIFMCGVHDCGPLRHNIHIATIENIV
jgi:hypothetical protein